MQRTHLVAAVTAAVLLTGGTATALALTGTSTHTDGHPSTGAASTPSGSGTTGTPAGTGATGTPAGSGATSAAPKNPTLTEAVTAALAARPGTVESADLERGRGGRHWEVDLLGKDGTWYEAHVDATTGRVHVTADPDDDVDSDDTALRHSPVDVRDAVTRARAAVPGTVLSADFDDHDHRPGHGWEIEVRGADGTTHEVMVDAGTGAVRVDHDD